MTSYARTREAVEMVDGTKKLIVLLFPVKNKCNWKIIYIYFYAIIIIKLTKDCAARNYIVFINGRSMGKKLFSNKACITDSAEQFLNMDKSYHV